MKHLLSSITILLLSTLAFGQVPNTFSSGETISSSKINANFAYLADSIKNDNISAMMVCASSGYTSTTPKKFYYGNCFSTDNTEFTINNGIRLYLSYYGTYTTYVVPDNYIEFKDLFNNKWILFDSKVNPVIVSSDVYVIQKHIFYKVSSD